MSHVLSVVFIWLMYVVLLGSFGGILALVSLDALLPGQQADDLFDRFPWMLQHLPWVAVFSPFVLAGLHDLAQTVRRHALRREYLAWAAQRDGQLARGTAVLPEPALLGAGWASLPARVLGPGLALAGLGAAVAVALDGDVGGAGLGLLVFGSLAAVLSGVSFLQRRHLRHIQLLHAAVVGPVSRREVLRETEGD